MISEGLAVSEAVIVAIITGVLAVVGSFVSNMAIAKKKARDDEIKDTEREVRQAMRLDNIEKKLDVHNGYAEKFGDIQKDIAVIKNDFENFKNRRK